MLIAALVLIGLVKQEPPETQSRRLSLVAQSSTNRLEDIAVNADETRILTHDREYSPRLWDRKTMRLLRVLDKHFEKVTVAEFSPDGKWVLTATKTELGIWDSKTGKLAASREVQGFDEFITEVTFTADSKHVIVGTVFGAIFVFDIALKEVAQALLFGSRVSDVQCAFQASVACAADSQGRVVAFTLPKLEPLATFETGVQVLWSRIDRKGEHVVATTIDEKAHLFDIGAKKKLRTYDHFMGTKGFMPLTLMASLFVGERGDQVLVAEENGLMRVYDVETGKNVGKLEGHTAQIREIRQTIDGTKVATYGDDEQLKIWDTVSQKELPFTRGPGGPTAGEFSLDGSAFWLGFNDGSLRRHDTKTGTYDSEAVGTTATTTFAVQKGRWLYYQAANYWIADLQNQTSVDALGYHVSEFKFSPDGAKARWKDPLEDDQYYLYDLEGGAAQMRYINCLGAEFTRDSKYLVTWHKDGSVYVWNSSDGESAKGWLPEKDIPRASVAVSPTDELLVSLSSQSKSVQVWNYMTGGRSVEFDFEYGTPSSCAFSNDGESFVVVGDQGVGVWSTVDGALVTGKTVPIQGENVQVSFSPNDEWVLVVANRKLTIINVARQSVAVVEDRDFTGVMWSPDSHIVLYDLNTVYMFDATESGPVSQVKLAETVNSVNFSDDGKKMLTTDSCDGLVVWQMPETIGGEFLRLGSFVQMKSDDAMTWLATDKDGRYDATDPANVTGAHYVLEWSGGLETIAVEQLKDQFFEPGLLAKILGIDDEKPRPVPSLDALKLYPSLEVSTARSGALRVSIEERDDGGVGVLRAWVNGKQVFTRNNPPGFFEIEPSTFERFFLPSNLLPQGQGNLVRFAITNKAGDLESPPVTVDVGVPTDLRPPEVKMYALFVGLNDYVGTIKDLTTPASDARELEMAVRTVANKLLPDHVETTLLTAEVGTDDTTRAEILAWFDTVAAKSSASDIVVVFFSGHGANEIAGVQDYFFLTPEADPTSVGALTASTASISGRELSARLAKIAASKQIVILDTCHSGAFATRLASEKSVSGDYRRAWQAIRDATGTWMLAGSAADQKSFESTNVGHGMLTYSLLEAIDRASSQGLRQTESGELFVDVEKWIEYAAARVESLKDEVGVSGVQRPQIARSAGSSFDIGVMQASQRGFIGLIAPRPIVIMGEFDQDKEDPLRIEQSLTDALKGDELVTVWTDVSAHPRAFRLTGSYSQAEGVIKSTVYLQRFGEARDRKTIAKFDVEGKSAAELVALIKIEALKQIAAAKDTATGDIKTGGG